ncbi:MAG: hypothetical protein L3J44_03315 [Campylobacteraceae bacterium]|nr:hypothetical protein [Campylobacteraceae bacterium]
MMKVKKIKKAVMLILVITSGVFFLLGCFSGPPSVNMQRLTLIEQNEYRSLESKEEQLADRISLREDR